MPCKVVQVEGVTMIVKIAPPRARVCSVCRKWARDHRLCDFPIGNGKTCDRVLCLKCAHHVEPDLDYCPPHEELRNQLARLQRDGGLKL